MTSGPDPVLIRVELPTHLRRLANVGQEITLAVPPPVSQRTLLDALELAYPILRGHEPFLIIGAIAGG